MPTFDPTEPIPEGRSAIEASAGTGKTYTIAAQVARLVAEDEIPIEKILVVTFTRAATAELKGRIRSRLVDSHRALSGDPSVQVDEHIQILLQADEATLLGRSQRLSEAITRFDQAQIFTIHSFSIQLLAHLGFYARISADLEPVAADASLISEVVADLVVAEFADDASGLVKDSHMDAIAKAVISHLTATIVPDPASVEGSAKIRSELAAGIRTETGRRLRVGGRAAFDHFLIEARDALTDPEIGAQARKILSARFAVALVDESQDTDPVQWELINAVFGDSRLIIIGDPKQSIYSFRGADIDSYLASVEQATTHRTMNTNWRSDGPLLSALDALLDGTTFGDERIRYRQVNAAPQNEKSRIHGAGAPLTIRRFSPDLPLDHGRSNPDKVFPQPQALRTVAADTAAEIVRLLTSDIEIDVIVDGKPQRKAIGPGDIAVLCRTRAQIKLVRSALQLRGVPSVATRAGSVFKSEGASEWRRFLIGIEQGSNPASVRYSATGVLIGADLATIAKLSDDDNLALQGDLRRWRELLAEDGIPAVMGDVSQRTGFVERVLGSPDGERLMTDLTHLADVMNEAWLQQRPGSMLGWLEDAMREANKETDNDTAEAREQRLETDAEAVQVLTIHSAKGLEYPIVLCPYSWTGGKRNKTQVPVFQDLDSDGETRHRVIDVGGEDSPDFKAHQEQEQLEDNAQQGRLLYVALTRARHLLIVWWIDNGYKSEHSKLHELVTRGVAEGDDVTELAWLVEAGGGTIALETLTEMPVLGRYESSAGDSPELSVATFVRPLDDAWRRASFSSLSPDHPIAVGHDTFDDPLREDETIPDDPVDNAEPVGASLTMPLAGVRGSKEFGTLVHEIFEEVPFDAADLEDTISTQVTSALQFNALNVDAAVLTEALGLAIHTPLGPASSDIALRQIPSNRCLDEMEFDFPVRTSGPAMDLHIVAAALQDHLAPDDPVRPYADQLDDLPTSKFRGYLNGSIDLTAAMPTPDGHDRYVVMDYKTNTLPTRGDEPTVSDYSFDPMHQVMQDSHYLLQSLIYQVALHRYLQWRLPNYDPERHLGGSAYLFVRGMVGPETPVIDGTRCGVYWWNPPAAMIVDLSRRFVGEGAT